MKTSTNLWSLSPSSLYSYVECKSCFWAENHIGKHPFTLPLRLNDAMDAKMKSRYDRFRAKGEMPPELKNLKGYKLFDDFKRLELMRTHKSEWSFTNAKDGYLLQGKLDEILVNPKGQLVPADYKSSGDPPKEDKYKYYELQLNAYGQMLKNQGFKVANEAYLLHYFPKDRTDPSLNVELDFHIDRVKINLVNFLKTMREMVKLLDGPYPGFRHGCKRCDWLEKRENI